MKSSELRKELEKLEEKVGDVEVSIDAGAYLFPLDEIFTGELKHAINPTYTIVVSSPNLEHVYVD